MEVSSKGWEEEGGGGEREGEGGRRAGKKVNRKHEWGKDSVGGY